MDISLLLKFAAYLFCTAFALLGVVVFDRRMKARFQFRFITVSSFFRITAAVLLLTGALIGFRHKNHDWQMVGWFALVLGGILLWYTLYMNFTRTNLFYGISGTVLQILLFTTLGTFGVLAGFFAGSLIFMLGAIITPVFVVNRNRKVNG